MTIRILLRHNPRSGARALINQLGLEGSLEWVDTAGIINPTDLLSTGGLTFMRFYRDGPALFLPMLDGFPHGDMDTASGNQIPKGSRIPFAEWWENPVMKDTGGRLFSRSQLVLALCDKEGGNHIDPEPAEAYSAIRSGSMGLVSVDDDGVETPSLSNPWFPSVRQISYEVIESLRQQQHLLM